MHWLIVHKAGLGVARSIRHHHRRAEAQHQETDATIHQWMLEGEISKGKIGRLRAILADLSELYERHILLEETDIFPLVGDTLGTRAEVMLGAGEVAQTASSAPIQLHADLRVIGRDSTIAPQLAPMYDIIRKPPCRLSAVI